MVTLLFILVPPGLTLAGLALIWGTARTSSSSSAANLVSTIGWGLLLIGIFSAVGLMANMFFIVAWIVTAVVLLAMVGRYQSAERRSLLWMLMLAAERGIPLETAARAFASERNDQIGVRVMNLAEYLEAGLPLALALKRARLPFPHSVSLAAELGQQTGDLSGALRRVLDRTDESEVIATNAAEKVFYLVFLVLFGLSMTIFMMWWIVPRLRAILEDFSVETPPATHFLIGLSNFLHDYWALVLPAVVFLLILLWRSLSYYTGFSPRYLPGMSSSWRVDRSVIMQWLAHAVRRNRPLPEMMRLVAGYLTRRGLRRKLEWAAKRIQQGADWTDSLRTAGLIRKSEAAVFRSAERAGNLAWALEEMAQSSLRRSAYRLRAAINLAFPAATIVLGAYVLLVALAILSPLFHLIGRGWS